MLAWSSSAETPFPDCRLLISYYILTWWRTERGSKLSCDLYMGPNPFHEVSTLMTSSNPNYLPKAPPPNTITSEGRVTTYEFWGETNSLSITAKVLNMF